MKTLIFNSNNVLIIAKLEKGEDCYDFAYFRYDPSKLVLDNDYIQSEDSIICFSHLKKCVSNTRTGFKELTLIDAIEQMQLTNPYTDKEIIKAEIDAFKNELNQNEQRKYAGELFRLAILYSWDDHKCPMDGSYF